MFDWVQKGNEIIGKDFIQYLKAHINAKRSEKWKVLNKMQLNLQVISHRVILQEWTKKIDNYKTQQKKDEYTQVLVQGVKFLKEHVNSIVGIYNLYLKLIQAKNLIVNKLENYQTNAYTFKETDKGFEVTGEEGFVAVDRSCNALKLIDRLEFSRLNFGSLASANE